MFTRLVANATDASLELVSVLFDDSMGGIMSRNHFHFSRAHWLFNLLIVGAWNIIFSLLIVLDWQGLLEWLGLRACHLVYHDLLLNWLDFGVLGNNLHLVDSHSLCALGNLPHCWFFLIASAHGNLFCKVFWFDGLFHLSRRSMNIWEHVCLHFLLLTGFHIVSTVGLLVDDALAGGSSSRCRRIFDETLRVWA